MRKKLLIFHRSWMSLTSFFLLLHYITPSQFFNNHMLGQFFNNHKKKWKDFYLCVNRNTFLKKLIKKSLWTTFFLIKIHLEEHWKSIVMLLNFFFFLFKSMPSTKESNFHFKRYLMEDIFSSCENGRVEGYREINFLKSSYLWFKISVSVK